MIKLFNQKHEAIGYLVHYKDCKIESEVATGDKTLSFTYLDQDRPLENEMYVQMQGDEYVIKEVPCAADSFSEIVAVLNLEELQGKMWQSFSVTGNTIEEAASTALAGTGWRIGVCDVTKKRNAGMLQVSSLGVIQNLCKAFLCEPVFDTINKTVSFYEKRGEDKGVYFMSGLNLKKLQKKSTSYDYYTRIIPIGADGITIESVNDGKNYLENYQYSDKVLTYLWKDESYTGKNEEELQAFKEDAQKKLMDLSKPEVSYQVEIRNLAAQNPEYGILSYGLGDTVKLIDARTGVMEQQRIKKLVHYPENPERDTCEIANTVLTFEELQQRYRDAAEIINCTVAGDGRYTGKINVSDILHFEQGIAGSSTISGLNSCIHTMQGDLGEISLSVGKIETNYLKTEEADIKYASIERLDVAEQQVHDLRGDYAAFETAVVEEISGHKAVLDQVSGELSDYKTTVAQELIAAKGWMAEASIGETQISSVNANKITSGSINTANVTIAGTDSRLQISDNTIQIRDTARVRVQVGKDASGDYTLAVWDANGNLMWDALGATEHTIRRKIIRDTMVADDAAIQAMKIDFQSLDTILTDQGVTISGTVIQVGDKNLNIAFSEQMQLMADQGETLADHTAKIAANEKNISLKVDSQIYQTDQEKIQSSLTKATSDISVLQGQIALKVEQTDIENIMDGYSTVSQMEAAVEVAKEGILSTVSSLYVSADALEAVSTVAQQAADRFSWLVKSGTSETDFTLTDRTAKLITDNFVITDSLGKSTIISGGKMDINKIFAQDIQASGTIEGVTLKGAKGSFSGEVEGTIISAENSYYIRDEYNVKRMALQAVVGSVGVSLDIGKGFSSTHIYGINGIFTVGDLHVLEDSSGIVHCGGITGASAKLARDGNLDNKPMIFYWQGEAGQPSWIWGGNDGTNMYVYNPKNFSVNYANSAGTANTATSANSANTANSAGYAGRLVYGSRSVRFGEGFTKPGSYALNPCGNAAGTTASDGGIYLGGSGSRWHTVFAVNGCKTSSDARDKIVQGEIDERYRALFRKLRPVLYKWKKREHGTRTHFGLVAQEVEAAAAECGISYDELEVLTHDYFKETEDGRTDRYSLSYDELSVLTMREVQELQKELSELQKENVRIHKELEMLKQQRSAI